MPMPSRGAGRTGTVSILSWASTAAFDLFEKSSGVLIDAPKSFGIAFRYDPAEVSADGIDKNEVGLLEQAICIVHQRIGTRRFA